MTDWAKEAAKFGGQADAKDWASEAAKFGGTASQQPIEQSYATPAEEMKASGLGTRSLVGFASPMVETYYGAKQLLSGGLSPEDQANLKAWQGIGEEAPFLAKAAGVVAPMVVGGTGLARAGVQAGKIISKVPILSRAAPIASGLSKVGKVVAVPATVGQGAATGATMAALQPADVEAQGYEQVAGSRIAPAAIGAVVGAASTAIANRIGSYLAQKFGSKISQASEQEIDDAARKGLEGSGINYDSLGDQYKQSLKQQIVSSLASGKKLDVSAAARKAEFEQLGIKPTLGQITRDPMQYATEQNLRGVAGVGEPIAARLSEQEQAMRKLVGGYAKGAEDRYLAGQQIGGALTKADEAMSQNIRGLYQQARESAGKDLEIPLQGMAQDVANVVDNFGDKVPSGVRNQLAKYGLLGEKQTKLFTVEESDKLLKVINANQSNDPAVNASLAELRNALRTAVGQVAEDGGVYAPAVKAAAKRFQMHDMLPALQQAARGEIDADKFVARHIIGSKPESVMALANMLKSTDQEAYQQARAQVGEYLRRSAYGLGEGLSAGDTAFRPASFGKALDSLGARLNAFFSPEEISQLRQIARVGSYMATPPAKAAVSTSNSGVPVTNALLGLLGSKIPFASQIGGMAKGAMQTSANRGAARQALEANIPTEVLRAGPAEVERYQNALRRLMFPAAMGISQ